MKTKLYVQLLLATLIGNYVVADADGFFSTIGRTLNGNGSTAASSAPMPIQKISFSDAKDLKGRMKSMSKNVSNLSDAKKEAVKTKVLDLENLINQNQVFKKGKVKKSRRQ